MSFSIVRENIYDITPGFHVQTNEYVYVFFYYATSMYIWTEVGNAITIYK